LRALAVAGDRTPYLIGWEYGYVWVYSKQSGWRYHFGPSIQVTGGPGGCTSLSEDGQIQSNYFRFDVATTAADTFLTDVVAVAGKVNYCLAIRSDGSLWGWGTSRDGVLGTKIAVGAEAKHAFRIWDSYSDFVDVDAGEDFVIATRLVDGKLQWWGWGRTRALLTQPSSRLFAEPVYLGAPALGDASFIYSCGAYHRVMITSNQCSNCLGQNRSSQCNGAAPPCPVGHGHISYERPHILGVAGWHATYALGWYASEANCYPYLVLWGGNPHLELGGETAMWRGVVRRDFK
jgi:hypothetical protein